MPKLLHDTVLDYIVPHSSESELEKGVARIFGLETGIKSYLFPSRITTTSANIEKNLEGRESMDWVNPGEFVQFLLQGNYKRIKVYGIGTPKLTLVYDPTANFKQA